MGTQAHHSFPLLDAIRALAAISVLVVHTAIFSGAVGDPIYGRLLAHLDIGVPFFFLLSAFLLYRPFVEARVHERDRPCFAGYGRRRFVRIAPAYWVALTVAAIVPGLAGAFSGNWWVYYGLLQNFPVYEPSGTCAVTPFRCGIPLAWSLTVEVLFYLALPLFVLAMASIGRRWRGHWLRLELVALGMLTTVSIFIQSSVPTSDIHTFLFYSPLGRGWWFALGLLFAALSVYASRRDTEPLAVSWLKGHAGVPIAVGVGIYAFVAIVIPGPSLSFPVIDLGAYVSEYLLVGVIAALIVAPAIFGADGGGLSRRILGHPVFAWLGLVSYGIFLYQFPALILLLDAGVETFVPLTIATFAVTVPCAAASFYLLERPLMQRVRRRATALSPSPASSVRSPAG